MLEDFKNSSEVIMKKVLVGFGLFAISLSSFASGKYGKFSYCSECVDEYALYKGQETVSAYESYQVGQYIYIAEDDASFQIQFILTILIHLVFQLLSVILIWIMIWILLLVTLQVQIIFF